MHDDDSPLPPPPPRALELAGLVSCQLKPSQGATGRLETTLSGDTSGSTGYFLDGTLAAIEVNLMVIKSALHRNFHRWMAACPREPKDFADYLLRNELSHFEGGASPRVSQAK